MSDYQLRSGSTTLVTVAASSNLDGRGTRSTRRGTVFDTLDAVVTQYHESPTVGQARIEWRIPFARGPQRGVLQSASVGSFGDELVLVHPTYGSINVAVVPGLDGYEETPLDPVDFGFEVIMRFTRLN